MQISASPNDTNYLLNELDIPVFSFKAKHDQAEPAYQAKLTDLQRSMLYYVRSKPHTTVNKLYDHVQQFGAHGYKEVRDAVRYLMDAGLVTPAERVPLEHVDGRYERVLECDLCGSPSDKHPIVLWKWNTPVVRCVECGLMYANPRWKAEHLFGRYTQEYWDGYEGKADVVEDAMGLRHDVMLGWLADARQNGRLLDVGCATGLLLGRAKRFGWDLYGLETSAISAQIARETTGAEVHIGTLDTAPYPDGWFDALIFLEVVEHLQSPRAYIEKIARLLRPDGLLMISTPNVRSLSYRLLGNDWDVIGPNDHLYYFNPRTLERLLKDAGFAIYKMYSTATEVSVFKKWLKSPALQRLAPKLVRLTSPVVRRFMWGDGLYVVAQRQ